MIEFMIENSADDTPEQTDGSLRKGKTHYVTWVNKSVCLVIANTDPTKITMYLYLKGEIAMGVGAGEKENKIFILCWEKSMVNA